MKKIKMAINGFGRIGRQALKIAWEKKNIKIVAVNDLTDCYTLAHLLKHDTAYSDFSYSVDCQDEYILIGGKKVVSLAEKDPAFLPWKKLGVDVVLECTGVFRTRELAAKHLEAGAKKVVISAPAKGGGVKAFVRGVNCESYKGEELVDNGSCTTNCVAPVIRVMNDIFGIKKAILSTIHSYTSSQNLQDGPHKDLRRARAAAQNLIPTTTGAAEATTKVVAGLEKKFDGMAIRVPTIVGSLSDFTIVTKKKVTVEEVNQAFQDAAEGYLKGILAVTDEPLVSSDFIGNPYSAIVDLKLTKVVDGDLVKIIAWYDNEWAYAHRLVEMAEIVSKS